MPRLRSVRSILTPAPPTALPLVLLIVAGCAAPERGASGAPALVYVANSLDGTVSRLDAHSGRALRPPLSVEPAPIQMVSGAGGGLLVLSQRAGSGAELRHVAAVAVAGHPAASRPVPLQPAAPEAHEALLAGDGDRHAVLVYASPGSDAPRVALVDVATGTVAATQPVPAAAAADAVVRSVALERGPAGPIAYLGLWRWPAGGDGIGQSAAGGGLIVALHAETGAVLGSVRIDGAPTHLLLAPAPSQTGHRLYAVQRIPGPVRTGAPDAHLPPRSWELLTLNPATLEVERTAAFQGELTALTSAPDGAYLYALAQHEFVSAGTATTALLRVDPTSSTSGAVRALARLPGIALGLAATDERIYASNAFGVEVWAIDRRSGRLLQTIPVGQHPLGIALGSAQTMAGSAE